MLEELLSRLRDGERPALSRLLTLADRPEYTERIQQTLEQTSRTARVVAITGNSGVGKSTLIGRLIDHLRGENKSVAVLACDPQSSLTGGALLGDRVRMPSRPDDAGVFIRSLAATSGSQAIAEHLDVMVTLLSLYGYDVVLLETVGAGQGDTAVRAAADIVVLLLQPEIGDELQWEKAGILEVADIAVVQKADLPGAAEVEAQVQELLNLPGCRNVPVLRVSASKGEGIDELWELVESLPVPPPEAVKDGRELLRIAQQHLADLYSNRREAVDGIVRRWQSHELSESEASEELIHSLLQP